MSNSLLGMHWMRLHPDQTDYGHVERMQYKSVKLFEWSWSDRNFCRDLLSVLPKDSYILARDHPLSEQPIWDDPVGIGTRQANEWAQKVQEGRVFTPLDRTFFLGKNEPDATTGDRNAIDLYTEAFMRRLAQHGLRGGAFNFSTGHPRTVDGTPNTKADYSVFESSHQAIVDGKHIAVLHIYGTAAVPCVPGHYDRLKACTWQDVQWVVGECGADEHVVGGGNHDGYLISMRDNPAHYCSWLDQLIIGVNDPRIHSVQVFTYDFSHPWSSFDIRPIRDALEGYAWQHMTAPQTPPSTIHLPVIGTGPTPAQPPVPTNDNWARSIAFVLEQEGGLSSDPNDPGNYVDGKFVGTKFGISANAHPNVDIVNLTVEQAKEIYRNSYWGPSGAATMPWPLCLAMMDLAVNGGVGRAQQALNEAGHDFVRFMAWRIAWYTRINNFELYGRAWIGRCSRLMMEATRP